MRAITGRLHRLEVRLAPQRNRQGQSPVEVLLAQRARRLAHERGVPYEEALRETVAEHQVRHQAFMANYDGDGSIADILRYDRRRRFEAMAAAQKAVPASLRGLIR